MHEDKLTERDVRRFWSKVNRSGEQNGCWLWVPRVDVDGYGHLSLFHEGKRYCLLSHRVSFYLQSTEIDDGLQVNHTCDNPRCVRPDHLYQGTQLDNMQDRLARDKFARGRLHHNTELNEEIVAQIKLLRTREWKYQDIADEFGTTVDVVGFICRGVTWKHVPWPVQCKG
jgi:hypothetical protein